MRIRSCTKCNKDYEDYKQKSSFCRPCKRVYDREYHYNRSKSSLDKKREHQKANRKRKQDYVIDYLESHPCVQCGESEMILLDFDHIDQSTKTSSVSQMVCINLSIAKIQEEIDKCQVLCVSCHRRKTAKQLGWYKYKKLNQAIK